MRAMDTPIEILLVEDSKADIRLTREALVEARVRNVLRVATTAEAALEILHDPEVVLPDLILLDLNLPGMDGKEFLRTIKNDPKLELIPVVVLTTSRAEEDILRAYRLKTNCYVVKPLDLAQFIRVIESVQDFWLSVVKLPPKASKQESDWSLP